MTQLLELVVYMTLLTFLAIMLGAVLRNREWTPEGMKVGFSNRDKLPEATPLGGRAERAAQNTKENFLLFVPLALVAHVSGHADQATTGALIFFYARIIYLPVYLLGITYLRSVIWGAGIVGLGMMTAALI